MSSTELLSLPQDILSILPEYLHTIEDLVNTASTCRRLRACMATAPPNVILRLAAAQSRVFFRPSPYFLAVATARELGEWARRSDANEQKLAFELRQGTDGLLALALEHCGLTLDRIRQLHLLRFSIINPVANIIDKCVGEQWSNTPNFWSGGVSDAVTIDCEPIATFFHLAIYGELFAPDFEPILNQDPNARRLSVDTRIEFIKYCVPDPAFYGTYRYRATYLTSGDIDPRSIILPTGPYARRPENSRYRIRDNNLALRWLLRSSRFRPRYKALRIRAGVSEFQVDSNDGLFYSELAVQDWRQRLLEHIMVCQGLEGMEMLKPVTQDQWISKIWEWKKKIAKLDQEPSLIQVGHETTLEYPYLSGDLRVCTRF